MNYYFVSETYNYLSYEVTGINIFLTNLGK